MILKLATNIKLTGNFINKLYTTLTSYLSPYTLYLILYALCLISCQSDESIDPQIKSNEASNIGISQVTLSAEVKDLGVFKNVNYGFLWSENPGININADNKIILGQRSAPGEFSVQIPNLKQGSIYYARPFLSDLGYSKIYYGMEISFTTLMPSNLILTLSPTEVTSNAAILNGEIKDLGQFTTVQYGFVWSKLPNPTINSEGKQTIGVAAEAEEFSLQISDLAPGTTYYYRAFLMDENATSIVYGNELTFETQE